MMPYSADFTAPHSSGKTIPAQNNAINPIYPQIPESSAYQNQLSQISNFSPTTSSLASTITTSQGTQGISIETSFTEFNPFVIPSLSIKPPEFLPVVTSSESNILDRNLLTPPTEKQFDGYRGRSRSMRKSKSDISLGNDAGDRQIPDFICRLYRMVEENSRNTDSVVCWNSSGTTFLIKNVPKFIGNVLLKYFKTGNIQSFVRQLNKYGFTKKKRVDDSVWEFEHQDLRFRRNNFEMLATINIKPKEKNRTITPTTPTSSSTLPITPSFNFSQLPGTNRSVHTDGNETDSTVVELQEQLEKLNLENKALKRQRQIDQNENVQLKGEMDQLKRADTEKANIIQQLQEETTKLKMEIQRLTAGTSNSDIPQGLKSFDLAPFSRNSTSEQIDNIATPILPSTPSAAEEGSAETFQALRAKHKRENRGRDLKVLVVDDDMLSRLTVSKWLQDYGCKPDSVSSGEAAVEKSCTNRYDIILMDILMPGKFDGIQATKLIRQRDAHARIIAMTSRTEQKFFREYIEAGMNDILHKTGKGDEFLNKISSVHKTLPMTLVAGVPKRMSVPDEFYPMLSQASHHQQTSGNNYSLNRAFIDPQLETLPQSTANQTAMYGVATTEYAPGPRQELHLLLMQQPTSYLCENDLSINDVMSIPSDTDFINLAMNSFLY